jgi:hypothetical protein
MYSEFVTTLLLVSRWHFRSIAIHTLEYFAVQ